MFEDAIHFARAGLVANPDDQTLLNNLAVSLASSDRAMEALDTLTRMDISKINTPSLAAARLATSGLIAFRLGDTHQGRLLYLQAIEYAKGTAQGHSMALALAYLAREEMLAGLPTGDATLAEAHDAAKDQPSVVLRAFLARLEFRRTLASAGRP